MKFVIFTILFAGACFAFPQDQSLEATNNAAKSFDGVTKGFNDLDTLIEKGGLAGVQGDLVAVDTAIQDVISGFDETDAALTSDVDPSIGIQHIADAENEVYAAVESLTDGSSTATTGSLDTVNSDMDALTQKIDETIDIFATLPEEISRPLGFNAAISDVALSLDSLGATRIDLGPTIKRAIAETSTNDATVSAEPSDSTNDVTVSFARTAEASENLGRADQRLADAFTNLLRQ